MPQGGPAADGVVDFDALHAALGDLPPPAPSQPQLPTSDGRSSATYASSRPHVIPAARQPQTEELNAPAVIVAPEVVAPERPAHHASDPALRPPHAGNPLAPSTPTSPFTPHAGFAPAAVPPQAPPDPIHRTMRMPDAPMRVRMPRAPTMVVPRRRGPTRTQKLVVFLSMLLVFVAGGVVVLAYYQPDIFGPHAPRPQAATPTTPVAVPTPVPMPTVSVAVPVATLSAAPTTTPPPPVATSAPPAKKVAPKRTPAPAPAAPPAGSAEPRF